VSAVRWTAKGNLVVTGGHLATVQQLQLVAPILAQTFSEAYSTAVTPITLPHTRANVKWSKILINGLPTGVSDSQGPYTPEECHTALTAENPSYAPLLIAQSPSWVKPPQSYTNGSSSSIVVAFEDPDGTKARTLLGAKYLYAFGTRASLQKWKQRPTTTKQPSSYEDDMEIVTAPSQLPSTFLFSGQAPAAATPGTRQSAVRQPMATQSATARNASAIGRKARK